MIEIQLAVFINHTPELECSKTVRCNSKNSDITNPDGIQSIEKISYQRAAMRCSRSRYPTRHSTNCVLNLIKNHLL